MSYNLSDIPNNQFISRCHTFVEEVAFAFKEIRSMSLRGEKGVKFVFYDNDNRRAGELVYYFVAPLSDSSASEILSRVIERLYEDNMKSFNIETLPRNRK